MKPTSLARGSERTWHAIQAAQSDINKLAQANNYPLLGLGLDMQSIPSFTPHCAQKERVPDLLALRQRLQAGVVRMAR